jgi:hypothetical protein
MLPFGDPKGGAVAVLPPRRGARNRHATAMRQARRGLARAGSRDPCAAVEPLLRSPAPRAVGPRRPPCEGISRVAASAAMRSAWPAAAAAPRALARPHRGAEEAEAQEVEAVCAGGGGGGGGGAGRTCSSGLASEANAKENYVRKERKAKHQAKWIIGQSTRETAGGFAHIFVATAKSTRRPRM